MKRLIFLIALLALAGTAHAATIGNWSGAANDGGLWSTDGNWGSGSVPVAPATSTGDEIKMQLNSTAVIDSTMSYDHNCRLTIGNDTGGVMTINVTGGFLGASELRVGAVRSTSQNGIAEMYQTNGTVEASQFVLGRGGSTSSAATATGSGLYVISGGTLQAKGTDGRMYIGCGVNTVTGADISQQVGKLIVDGALSTINMKTLYVGGDGTKTGTGIVEFKVGASGVSKISLSNAAILDGGAVPTAGIANLILTATAPLGAGDIVLVDTTSATAVAGIFDQLNGVAGAAGQGASVALGGNSYTLSYIYDATTGIDGNGNDIALVYVPEPATLAVLGLGGLFLRRRFA